MAGLLESCQVHGGTVLPGALFAPRETAGQADLYWRGAQTSPVSLGEAVDVRGATWLVVGVSVWRGTPGGSQVAVRLCNAFGALHTRTATVTAYGLSYEPADPVPVIGELVVSATAETDGTISTTADLTPAGAWQGAAGDLVVLDDQTRWEQIGDPTDRASGGGMSPIPVVRLRRVRDGQTGQ